MVEQLMLFASMGAVTAAIYAMAMCATPRKGLMRIVERICMGAALCWFCRLVLAPMGIPVVQSPLAALSAGFWGLPGVALSSVLAHWP